MATSLLRFTRKERLHTSRDFRRIFKEGGVWHNDAVTLFALTKPSKKNDAGAAVPAKSFGDSRIGIIISRKTAGAVQRNKFKRRIREIFRLNKANFEKPVDIIMIGKKNAVILGYAEFEKKVLGLWRKAKL